MNIEVSKQTRRFYLAFDKWLPVIGHEIKVGNYKFCAIPLSEVVNISEVTSGCKMFNIPMNLEIMLKTASKEGSIEFFKTVGESLKRIIEKQNDFEDKIKKMKETSYHLLGEMPQIENIDTDWIFDMENDVLN